MDKKAFATLLENYGAISILKSVSETIEEAIKEGDNITVIDVIMILDGTIEMLDTFSETISLINKVKFPNNKEEITEFINSISVKEEN